MELPLGFVFGTGPSVQLNSCNEKSVMLAALRRKRQKLCDCNASRLSQTVSNRQTQQQKTSPGDA
jgi:hypothetical protein